MHHTISASRLADLRDQRYQAALAAEQRHLATGQRHLAACRELGRIVASSHLDFKTMTEIANMDGVSVVFRFAGFMVGRHHDGRRPDALGIDFPGKDDLYLSVAGKKGLDSTSEYVAFIYGVKEVFDQV